MAGFDAGDRFDVYAIDVQLQKGESPGLALANLLQLGHPAAMFIFVAGYPQLAVQDDFVVAQSLVSQSILRICGGRWRRRVNVVVL